MKRRTPRLLLVLGATGLACGSFVYHRSVSPPPVDPGPAAPPVAPGREVWPDAANPPARFRAGGDNAARQAAGERRDFSRAGSAAPTAPADRPAQLEIERDPEAALAAVTRLPDSERRTAAKAIIARLARSDPGSALAAAELFSDHVNDGRAEHIVQLWTEADPEAAIAWVAGRPPGPLRDQLLARVVWVRAQQDPVDAAALALELLGQSPLRDDALLSIVRHWAQRDGEAAAAWVGTFTDAGLRMRAASLLAYAGP